MDRSEPLLDDPRHVRLLDWELTPPASRQPSTQQALADELGVSPRTLRDWKESAKFQQAWQVAFKELAGSMERTKTLLDGLYQDATTALDPGDRARAAKLHWDISRQVAPPEPQQAISRRARELSDAELRLMLSDAALEELVSRREQTQRVESASPTVVA